VFSGLEVGGNVRLVIAGVNRLWKSNTLGLWANVDTVFSLFEVFLKATLSPVTQCKLMLGIVGRGIRCGIPCGDPLRKSEMLDDLTLVRKLPHGTTRLALCDDLVAKGKIAGSGMEVRSTIAIPSPLPVILKMT
jgi:hypothetical protein